MGIETINLESRTVFWKEDLGLDVQTYVDIERAAKIFDEEIGDWLTANCKGAYNAWSKGVWFAEPKDAALFKLFFSGKF